MPRALVFLFCAAVLYAADDLPTELAIARDTAPEFFAAAVLVRAENGSLARSANARELIEEAFALAGRAEEPVRLVAIPGLAPDTRAMHRVWAGALQLDALSLQSRLAVAMLRIDPARGRDLFEQVSRPPDQVRPCEDPLVADGSAYYRAAAEVLRKIPGMRLSFIQSVLAHVGSPSDAASFMELISSFEWRRQEWEIIGGEVGSKLESIAPDYRSFGLTFGRLDAAMKQIQTESLRRSLRTFIVAQENSARCHENYTVSELSLTAQPASRGAAFVAESYSELPGSKDIEEAFADLKVSPQGPRSEMERSTEEWQTMLADFLSDFEAWKPSGEPIDVFHQKADYWRGLIELTPRGETRDGLLSRAASFLASSRISREHPAEWQWQVQQLQSAAGTDKPKVQ